MINGIGKIDMGMNMSENMKRNIAGRDMKIDLLKEKIKAKKIDQILAGTRHG